MPRPRPMLSALLAAALCALPSPGCFQPLWESGTRVGKYRYEISKERVFAVDAGKVVPFRVVWAKIATKMDGHSNLVPECPSHRTVDPVTVPCLPTGNARLSESLLAAIYYQNTPHQSLSTLGRRVNPTTPLRLSQGPMRWVISINPLALAFHSDGPLFYHSGRDIELNPTAGHSGANFITDPSAPIRINTIQLLPDLPDGAPSRTWKEYTLHTDLTLAEALQLLQSDEPTLRAASAQVHTWKADPY